MPEGDTLYRIANQLRPILVDQTIQAASTWRPRTGVPLNADSLVGHSIQTVQAKGKHLLIALDDQRVVHSHLGMTGSWHVYQRQEPWNKPAHRAALVLSTNQHTVVCFTPKQLQLVTAARLKGDSHLRRLGPDLMHVDVDLAAILPRLRAHNLAPIGEAVMNQTLLAGIGNVYKSESLFLAKLNPWTPVGELSDPALHNYLQLTHKLMRRNRAGGKRTTRFAATGPRVWVYGRQGEPCLKCGTTIQLRRQGDLGRTTYWCSRCQPTADLLGNS